jgi:hypothetical protein
MFSPLVSCSEIVSARQGIKRFPFRRDFSQRGGFLFGTLVGAVNETAPPRISLRILALREGVRGGAD